MFIIIMNKRDRKTEKESLKFKAFRHVCTCKRVKVTDLQHLLLSLSNTLNKY